MEETPNHIDPGTQVTRQARTTAWRPSPSRHPERTHEMDDTYTFNRVYSVIERVIYPDRLPVAIADREVSRATREIIRALGLSPKT